MSEGTRRDLTESDGLPNPGEYGKTAGGWWYGCPPVPIDEWGFPVMGNLSQHTVTEHEDGTITVSPSILIGAGRQDKSPWHGFLERGIWRQV